MSNGEKMGAMLACLDKALICEIVGDDNGAKFWFAMYDEHSNGGA
jgi:hypothetical protein